MYNFCLTEFLLVNGGDCEAVAFEFWSVRSSSAFLCPNIISYRDFIFSHHAGNELMNPNFVRMKKPDNRSKSLTARNEKSVAAESSRSSYFTEMGVDACRYIDHKSAWGRLTIGRHV